MSSTPQRRPLKVEVSLGKNPIVGSLARGRSTYEKLLGEPCEMMVCACPP